MKFPSSTSCIIGNCHNGLLVDPLDTQAIAAALLSILNDPRQWQSFSESGLRNVRRYYSWRAHARRYMDKLQPLLKPQQPVVKAPPVRNALRYRSRAIFTDIDQSLLGNTEGLRQFVDTLRSQRKNVFFGIATGRRLDSALAILKKNGVPTPDVLIASLGTEIYYAPHIKTDTANQAFGQFFDIVPARASKGLALRYFAQQPHALGIVEAIEHYDFFDDRKGAA